ncbi:hypothetical protein PTKIN_Ptkin13bG0233200 [Pterospermum kingtungense]
MRPNIVSEAGLQTRASQWWDGIPFLTSAVIIVCGAIYLICLLFGYDSFHEICFLPGAIVSHFQVYRIYTSILFHGSLLHVFFNMLALVPLGSELERIMGSIRLLYMIILLATSNAIFHLTIALVVAHNPFQPTQYLMNECAIGFSGILFSMIVIETSLSGVQSRRYAFMLLVIFQLLMTNVSLLGHLCGILSGFAYTYGLFNFLIPGPSFYSAIESSSLLAGCVRRPKFILCSGGNPSAYVPTYSGHNSPSSGLFSGNIWRNFSSWMPQRETAAQSTQDDSRFPGRGRTLGSGQNTAVNSDLNLQARLLDNSSPNNPSDISVAAAGERLSNERSQVNNAVAAGAGGYPLPQMQQGSIASEEQIQKLVSMGFERTQVEVAIAAADGDLTVAVEILMSQEG